MRVLIDVSTVKILGVLLLVSMLLNVVMLFSYASAVVKVRDMHIYIDGGCKGHYQGAGS
jgi:hypothetical protein